MVYSLGARVGYYDAEIRRISVSGGVGSGQSCTVYKDDKPYLEVITPRRQWNQAFNSVYIFHGFLCIGLGDLVYFIDIETGEVKTEQMELYFTRFYEHEDRLYAASGERLHCFDRDCVSLWRSDALAVDGVVITEFLQNAISVSCEMDPPGGWVDRYLDYMTGKEVKGSGI